MAVWLGIIYGAGIIGLVMAFILARMVLAMDRGTPEMQRIAALIYTGAQAFLRRQYVTIATYAVGAAIAIGVILAFLTASDPVQRVLFGTTYNNLPRISAVELGIKTAIAFAVGAFLSGLCGYIGMSVAVQANLRTAAAARQGLGPALLASLRGGAVSGFLIVALSLLGVTTIFLAYGGLRLMDAVPAPGAPGLGGYVQDVSNIISSIIGFGFGASFVALFAQLGGGIYTKAADVGADLVGKVEAGIPEDDPRNPAVIADLVGDNVGDCAGRGADIFESTVAENIGAMVLGVALFAATREPAWIIFPLVIMALGIIAGLIGLFAVRPGANMRDPMDQMNLGYYVTSALSAVGIFVAAYLMLNSWQLGVAGIIGVLTSIAFVFITQYYTSGSWRPVREIAESSKTGPATVIISGIAIGFETTVLSTLTIGIALISSFLVGNSYSLPDGSTAGIYGTAVATMGMLMGAVYILAMDNFGPITDNAGGIVEMSNAPEEVRAVTDILDSAGNTTKALTKGYAVGSAALAAFLLFSAYLSEAGSKLQPNIQVAGRIVAEPTINLAKPGVFIGALVGAMLVYFFTSLAIRAVGKAAGGMIEEVRRQFRADPGIMAGTSDPDYARCVDIATTSALRQMIAPGAVAVLTPIAVGVIFRLIYNSLPLSQQQAGFASASGAEVVGGLLLVGTITGVLMALFLNNGGGAWDNAKKYIEAGNLKDATGKILGKKTDAHAAAVVGDTVGDPFKDTAGPSLHVLIKLLSTLTLVLLPLYL